MTVRRLVERYAAGAVTADHLFVDCLHLIDPAHPGAVLGDLPDSLLDRFSGFVHGYDPDRAVATFGPLPARDQVEASARWLAAAVRRTPAGSN